MRAFSSHNGRLLGIILAYGFVITVLNLGYNSVYHDEALNILMGRQVLSGEFCPGCAQNTGSVIVQPVLSAIGDLLGGLKGARAVGIPFGLGLTAIIYLYAKKIFSVKNGLLSAAIFTFTGTTLYLSKLATYDIVSAFFLGLSFYLIVASENQPFTTRSALLLFAGSTFLFLAAMTKYVVSIHPASPLICGLAA
jgi:4-amino-4-deoxy-L-arabinose transferase-like glycosyltransferase